MMSISQIIIFANWLFDKNLLEKFKLFFKNKIALIFISIFLLHIVWLFNTTDFDYALLDIKIKLPIFILTLVLSTTPQISKSDFFLILKFHIATVFVSSLISFYIYFVNPTIDFRSISPFISHIRFALNVCVAFFTSIYFILNDKDNKKIFKLIYIIISIIFVLVLIILQSITGLFIIATILFSLTIYYLIKNKFSFILKIFMSLILLFILSYILFSFYNVYNNYFSKPQIDFSKLDKYSNSNNLYIHDTTNYPIENGNWIGLYICQIELEDSWNKVSELKFNGKDKKGQSLAYTLIRYLSSKNYRKDKIGIEKLNKNDILNIENGIANYNYLQTFSFKPRLLKLFWEINIYKQNHEINGHSLLQRIELWKTSIKIIKKHFWLGVGTGDIPNEFKEQLNKDNSNLKNSKLRSHNQFFSIFIGFGIFGFLLFLFAFYYPFLSYIKQFDYFCVIFLMIITISMLTEDTIETQAGVTLFAFFSTFYLFQKKQIKFNDYDNKKNNM